jgi:hypothetical protein
MTFPSPGLLCVVIYRKAGVRDRCICFDGSLSMYYWSEKCQMPVEHGDKSFIVSHIVCIHCIYA